VPCQHQEHDPQRSEFLPVSQRKSKTAQPPLAQGPELQNCDCIAIIELLRRLQAAHVPLPTHNSPLCLECGKCRDRDCRAPHIGKRMVQAMRRTLSGLGSKARKRRAVAICQCDSFQQLKASSHQSTRQATSRSELDTQATSLSELDTQASSLSELDTQASSLSELDTQASSLLELDAEPRQIMEAHSRARFEAPTNLIVKPSELCDNQIAFHPSCDPHLSSQTRISPRSAQECSSSFGLSSPGSGIPDQHTNQSSFTSLGVSSLSEPDSSAQSSSGPFDTLHRSNAISRSKNELDIGYSSTVHYLSGEDDNLATSCMTDALGCDSPSTLVDEAVILQSLTDTGHALSINTQDISLQVDHKRIVAHPSFIDAEIPTPSFRQRVDSDKCCGNGQASDDQELPGAVEGLICVCHGLKCFPRLPSRAPTSPDTPYQDQLQAQSVSHRELCQRLPDCYNIVVSSSVLLLQDAGDSIGKTFATIFCDIPSYRTALASLRSLNLGALPSQPSSILSILFLYAAVVMASMDGEQKKVNSEAIFAEGLLWSQRIHDPVERRVFEEIVGYLWLPEPLQGYDQKSHSWTCSLKAYCPRSLSELHETADSLGNLPNETAASYRLRAGRLPHACYNHIYCG
jgi:hypothetical protein